MWYLTKMPKIVHFYWGNDTISYFRYLSIYSFKKLNPDWKVRLFYPKIKYRGEKTWHTSEHSEKFIGTDYFEQLWGLDIEKIEVDFGNYGMNNYIPETFKADFLRWHLLSTFGGLWSDCDIIYFQPMNSLYLNTIANSDIDTLICQQTTGNESYHSIGFLLGAADNPFYRFISNQTYRMLDTSNYQSIGSSILNYYFPNTSSIKERFPSLKFDNISPDVVYPINYIMVPYIFHTPYMHYLTDRTIGLHWFAGHPEARKFENIINEYTHIGYDNIISQIIRKVI